VLVKITFDTPINHPSRSGYWLEQFFGLFLYRSYPLAPVVEKFCVASDFPAFVDALKQQPHPLCYAFYTPLHDHRLSLQGMLFHPVIPLLQPQLPDSFQLIALSGFSPARHFPDLVARLYHILDDMDHVLHRLDVY
jgi:hypothetical protein